MTRENLKILRQQAVLDHSTFLVILLSFRVHLELFAAILARSLTHGTCVACQETFLYLVYARSPTATYGEN